MSDTTTPSTLVIEREMPHPAEKVWRALTQGHLMAEWLMPNDFVPIVGTRFNLRGTPQPNWNGVVDCEVLAVEHLRTLSFRWDSSGDEAATGLKTVVTWTLTPTANGVLLRMEQAGFREHETFNYQGAAYGWQRYLAALERVVAGLG